MEKRRLRSHLLALYSFLRREVEREVMIFSLVYSDRTCGSGIKLLHKRFRLMVRKHFFLPRRWSNFGTVFLKM